MGFFNRKKKENTTINSERYQVPPYEIKYRTDKSGRLMIEYIDNKNKVGRMYDTTRLIFTNMTENLNNRNVPNFLVSWYNQSDVTILDNSREFGSRVDYSEIFADIDLNLMRGDQQYCEMVMKDLLNQNRVKNYLDKGLEDLPGYPCGMYVGGVRSTQNGYDKFFDVAAGEEAHYKPYMIKMREKHKAEQQQKKQNQIARNRAEINRLQGQIDDWSK